MLAQFEPWRSEGSRASDVIRAHKPVADDIFREKIPLLTLAMDEIKTGNVPLWNPYGGSGMPLFATLNIGILDPTNILFFILPEYLAWVLPIIIYAFLIGVATYLYLRIINLSKRASFFGGISFMLSGFVVVRLIYGMYGTAILALPLGLYILESYLNNHHTKKILLLPFIVFLLLSTTQPQIALYVLIFFSIYTSVRIIQAKKTSIKKGGSAIILVLYAVSGVGLSAFQLLPSFEYQTYTNVVSGDSSLILDAFTVPVEHFFSIVVPNYFGNPSTYNHWGKVDYIQSIAYIGSIPFLFAYFACITTIKRFSTKIYLFTFLLTSLYALNWFGSKFLFSFNIPLISTGAPARILFLGTFSLAVLSGIGFDEFLKKEIFSRKDFLKMLPSILIILSIVVTTILFYLLHMPCENVIDTCRTVGLRNTILEFLFFIPGTIVFFGLQFIRKKKWEFAFYLFFIIVIVSGVYNANKFLPASSKDTYYPTTPIISSIRNDFPGGRVFGLGTSAIEPNILVKYKVLDPQYYHPFYILRYRELLEYGNSGEYKPTLPRGDARIHTHVDPDNVLSERRSRLFDLLSVEYLMYKTSDIEESPTENITIEGKKVWKEGDKFITHRKTALPRIYFVTNPIVLKSDEDILRTMFAKQFDYANTVVLEEDITIKTDVLKPEYTIRNIDYQYNSINFDITTNTNGIIVVTDNYYPDWYAYVDDNKRSVLRANYTFRAVPIEKGTHTVSLSYEPTSFSNGLLISVLSLGSIGVLLCIQRKIFT